MRPDDPQLILLLPALYSHLDPSRIPHLDRLDTELSASSEPVVILMGAIAALGCISVVGPRIPLEACADFWPRIWPWSRFIHTYLECIPGAPPEKLVCIQFLQILSRFQTHHETWKLIETTPGVGVIVARTWVLLLSAAIRAGNEPDATFVLLCRLLSQASQNDFPHVVEDYSEGAGGSASHLASLILEHINYGLTRGDSPACLPTLASVLSFVIKHYEEPSSEPLRTALLSRGFPEAVSRCLAVASVFRLDQATRVIDNAIHLVGWAFQTVPGYPYVREALQGGFLQGLVRFVCQDKRRPEVIETLKWFFESSLSGVTLYHSVLCQLRPALEEVSGLVTTDAFRRSGLFNVWDRFFQLATERLAIKEVFDSDAYIALKGCDNTKCTNINRRADVRRCSGCLNRYYCSNECQIVDWKEGGHRSFCAVLHTRLTPYRLSTHDKAFIHAIVLVDFKVWKESLYRRYVMHMHREPSSPVCTLFDYTAGRLFLSVVSVHSNPDHATNARIEDFVARIQRSGGRMALTIVDFPRAREAQRMSMAMRSSSDVPFRALRDIADSLPPGVLYDPSVETIPEIVMEKVRALVERTQDVIQFY
ncbi:hypothetical protein FB451DRAFT_1264212 [Mycena latifolia]|nr:hypothetical protein FB451DRAFT_1264212 [Mycena latifolia]